MLNLLLTQIIYPISPRPGGYRNVPLQLGTNWGDKILQQSVPLVSNPTVVAIRLSNFKTKRRNLADIAAVFFVHV